MIPQAFLQWYPVLCQMVERKSREAEFSGWDLPHAKSHCCSRPGENDERYLFTVPCLIFSPHFLSSSEKYPRVNRRKQKYPKASAERQGWNKSPEAPKCRHTLSIATATISKSLGPGYRTDGNDTPSGSAKCHLSDSRAFLQAKWFTRAPGPPIGIFHLSGY